MQNPNHKQCIWPDVCMHGPSIVKQCYIHVYMFMVQHLLKKDVLCNCKWFNIRLFT